MKKRWFGFRQYGVLDFGPPTFGDLHFEFSMNFVNAHNGDVIKRALFGWYLQTDLVDNSSGLERAPWPAIVKLSYVPTPDGEAEGGQPNELGGDALWREPVQWVPQTWTDGTLFATKWLGQSGNMRSGGGGRTIHDKTVAHVSLDVGFDEGAPGFTGDGDWLPVTVRGYLWCELLIETPFL